MLVWTVVALLSMRAVEGASQQFDTAFDELVGCHAGFGTCQRAIRSGNSWVLSGLTKTSKIDCYVNDNAYVLRWYEAYESASDFQDAVEKLEDADAAEEKPKPNKLRIAKLKRSVTVEEFKAQAGAEVDSFLFCDAGTYAVIEGSAHQNLVEFQFRLPDKLKVHPSVDMGSSLAQDKSYPRGQVSQVRLKLAPSSQGTIEQVSKRFSLAHAVVRNVNSKVSSRLQIRRPANPKSEDSLLSAVDVEGVGSKEDVEFLASLPEVTLIEASVPNVATNNEAALITLEGIENSALAGSDNLGEPMPEKITLYYHGLDGSGQIVTVVDSGLDMEHSFFSDPRINEAANKAKRYQRSNTVFDYPGHRKVVQYFAYADGYEGEATGHGTHVCGSVAGKVSDTDLFSCSSIDFGTQGKKTNGAYFEGIAPGAKLAFVDIGEKGKSSLTVPDHYEDIFMPSYKIGARIHTNSWGASFQAYLSITQMVDEFLFTHQDSTILFAAGNNGPLADTLLAQASCKSCVTVGATQNSDRSFAFLSSHYRTTETPLHCDTHLYPWNCAQSKAHFSSNGPTSDGRIKPDVLAPGYYIISADSAGGDGDPAAKTCGIVGLTGTSMATPVVAGNAAIVRQFLTEGYYPSGVPNEDDAFTPMGALIKAILIDGAEFLSGVQPFVDSEGKITNVTYFEGSDIPDSYQGFGKVLLKNTLRTDGSFASSGRNVWLLGDYADMPTLTRESSSKSYKVKVQPNQNMRATLVWYDPPSSVIASRAIVNDLDLTITGPDGQTFFGNGGESADRLNTVERIVISEKDLPGGEYVVTVAAYKLNMDNQPFALVLSGTFESMPSEVNDSNMVGIIVGSVVGGLALIAIIVILCICYKKRNKNKAPAKKSPHHPAESPNPPASSFARVPPTTTSSYFEQELERQQRERDFFHQQYQQQQQQQYDQQRGGGQMNHHPHGEPQYTQRDTHEIEMAEEVNEPRFYMPPNHNHDHDPPRPPTYYHEPKPRRGVAVPPPLSEAGLEEEEGQPSSPRPPPLPAKSNRHLAPT